MCQQENKGGVCIQILPPTHHSTWIPTNGSIINLSLCSINCHPLLLLLVRLHCKLNQRTPSIITVPRLLLPFSLSLGQQNLSQSKGIISSIYRNICVQCSCKCCCCWCCCPPSLSTPVQCLLCLMRWQNDPREFSLPLQPATATTTTTTMSLRYSHQRQAPSSSTSTHSSVYCPLFTKCSRKWW